VTRLLIWRHGQTEWNAVDRVQGQTDVGLDEVGRRQASLSAPAIAALRPDVIVSSDLSRAADTAAVLAGLTGQDVALDPRLRERNYGRMQGYLLTEIAERWPEEYAQWRAGAPVPELGAESSEELADRSCAAFRDAAERVPGGTVVIVTHGGSARHGCGALLGWPLSTTRTLGPLANCRWTELGWDVRRGWQLRAHNVGVPMVESSPQATDKSTEPAAAR
jgi:broad specificity phosphatase PhoE